ncbi:hypothetical protein M9979_12215 [Sphingomonas sp. RP10(2022)]|uniref:Uncharacterized protein n=1 Tax=Sphingomonas liriopis TaxID=2949094 RepID=A0A9X2HR39_9SPHN|nr:hypothetical protein [Sphingomonas liriopis]MCP3735638.1 hypothetical protein [Sphingomonas liriopis]
MFMMRATHDAIVAEMRKSAQSLLIEAETTIADLRAQLAERQVVAIRNPKTGRFDKREG